MGKDGYTISELEELTGTNRRTIHFYSQRGLLPRPETKGGGAKYPEEALIKLKLIKELQKNRYTLYEIREVLYRDYEKLKNMLQQTSLSDKESKDEIKSKDELTNHIMSQIRERLNMPLNILGLSTAATLIRENEKSETSPSSTEDIIRRLRIVDGVELNVKEEIYRKYKGVIRRGVNFLIKLLSQEGILK